MSTPHSLIASTFPLFSALRVIVAVLPGYIRLIWNPCTFLATNSTQLSFQPFFPFCPPEHLISYCLAVKLRVHPLQALKITSFLLRPAHHMLFNA